MKHKIKLGIVASLIIASIFPAHTLWYQLGRAPSSEVMSQRVPAVQFKNNELQNEIDTPSQTGDFSFTKLIREQISPSNPNRRPSVALPSVRSNLTELTTKASSIVWFGHSSYLLTLDGMTVLADPIMSGHASPFANLIKSFDGTDVYSTDDLPPIDVLLISHDHYDHLDYETVQKLKSKVKHIVVPLGVGEHFKFWGFDETRITELNWHESTTIGNTTFTATPTRHFSGRGLKRNNTLWASFVIKNAKHSIYMGGDSGYGPHYQAIGKRYGPFDLAMLENGQYNENWRFIHMMPEETVQAAQDLNAKVLFPVHWGKFVLSMHDWDEPIKRLSVAAAAQKQAYMTPKIGQVNYLNQTPQLDLWWQNLEKR